MMTFKGVYTALVTPFKNGKVDMEAYLKLAKRQVDAGVHGLVLTGTTGEAATLTSEEKTTLYSEVVKEFKGKVQIVAGTGSNNTDASIKASHAALECGVDGLLIVVPYYNKPTQAGMYAHFKKVADETKAPVILYNVPGRTSANMTPATIKKLSEIKNVVSVKEAGTFEQMNNLIPFTNNEFTVLSGDDFTVMPFLALGGSGLISVMSNIVPEKVVEMYNAVKDCDLDKARKIHYELYPLIESLFVEANPTPSKAALNMMGLIESDVRLPLVTPSSDSLAVIKQKISELGLV
jgi:4-hydroxy-tetrahydrodipicolinate synthase